MKRVFCWTVPRSLTTVERFSARQPMLVYTGNLKRTRWGQWGT